jgi:prepilin-type processing-associated H-X9-DG protein
MDENLVGYLLNALDPDARQQVEHDLDSDPEAGRRLELLRQALAPLAADRENIEPPPGLAGRTLARVADHAGRDLPHAPAPLRSRAVALGRPWWRRADVLVAASLLVFAAGLAIPGILELRYQHALVACQNNLRQFFTGLKSYSEQHQNNFPNVANAAPAPRNVAGLVVPILVSSGALPRDTSIRCPGDGVPELASLTLDRVLTMSDEEFQREVNRLACCYAYSLGYRNGDGVTGPRFDPNEPNEELPLMSDRPPADPTAGNSPNHGGRGQNVLYADGHVRFCTGRGVGFGGDDIFVNKANKVGAGLDARDAVLGCSRARP